MKVKIVAWAILTACMAMLLAGCSLTEKLQYFTPDETIEYKPDTESPKESDEQGTVEYSEEEIEAISQTYYGYGELDEYNQTLYLEMLESLSQMKDDVPLSTTDKTGLDRVFNCLMYDHPELFYVEGYEYTEYSLGGTITGITFRGQYSMGAEQVSTTKALLDAKINECLMYMPDNFDEYYKAKYLYEWVIDNTEYDREAENNQNICSVFLTGKSVCQGYARALQYMLQESGMESFIVTGFTSEGERHAWNLAKINGQYYYIDPTWGDPSYSYSGENMSIYEFAPSINYDYFLVTTNELTRTHTIEQVVELPVCTSMEDNYYVREGLYFTEYDEEKLAAVFDRYDSRQQGYVTIKCTDESYDDIASKLIDSQGVYDYVDKSYQKVAYSSNSELKTISFWNIY
jgi:hypothetical protein